MTFSFPRSPLAKGVQEKLRLALEVCPDVAFAHLVEVEVSGQHEGGQALFVWLKPEAMRSLRAALNLVSEAVSRSLPENRFVDVVILNSAPELLLPVEEADCLFVEICGDEREKALAAARASEIEPGEGLKAGNPWWWPF